MISDINEFYFKGVGLKHLQKSDFRNIKIPLPSKIIQEKIITEIGILEAKELKEKEKEDSLKKDIYKIYSFSKSKYPEVILSNEIEIIGGGTPDTSNPEYWDGNIPWLSIADFKGDSRYVETAEKSITEEGLKNSSTKYLEKDDIIISARGTVGALAQLKIPMTFNQSCYGIKANKSLIPDYLYFALKFEIEQFKNNAYGAIFDTITTRTFDLIKIPLPSLSDQQKIVREIEKIEKLINLSELKLHEFSKQKLAVLKKYL
jgi:restriction endonuclease S subunit